jgi:predicted CoA-binding protein
MANPDDLALGKLLKAARRIAVVGLSPKPHRDSNRVARYLLKQGYEVIPVYPRETEILGQRVFRRVQDIPGTVDIVNVFRRSEALPAAADDALAAGAPALWFQLGCVSDEAAQKAHAAGALLVMDRCILVDHARLIGERG